MRSSRSTLKDVAERSGFALRTVKKVMSGDTSVREKNREAILRAAEELNYSMNRAARAIGRQKQICLAIVYVKSSELYFPEVEKGFQRCNSELFDYGLNLEFHVASIKDISQQIRVLEALASRDDIDGVILQPLDPIALNAAIGELANAGKPVATFGTDAPDSKRLLFVGCNGYRAGRIAGQLMLQQIKRSAPVLALNTSQQSQMVSRLQGFIDRLKENRSTVPILLHDMKQVSEYYSCVTELVSAQDIAGIYCTNAHVIHAGQALRDLGRTDIPVIGYDISGPSASLLRTGHISFILDQRPEEHAYLSAKLLFEYLSEHKETDPIHHTPIYILNSECLDDF